MPWSAADASHFKKGLTPAQRRKWAEIANAILKSTGDESTAIRTANAKVGALAKRRR